jgi:hypothetical protein
LKLLRFIAKCIAKNALPKLKKELIPRPKLEIMRLLRNAIHDQYNEKQGNANPKLLKYPSFV